MSSRRDTRHLCSFSAKLLMSTAISTIAFVAPAKAQDSAGSETVILDQVVVTASRSIETIASIPGSVTVIERQEIEKLEQTSRSLGDLLGKVVPGLAPSSQTYTIDGQTLRGRNILVLIDGVPQNTNRNVSRDLFTIDTAAVERVEVIRGATAIYGNGATGGVINIITRSPTDGAPRFTTEVGGSASLSHPSADSLGGRVEQTVSGSSGMLDYVFSASAEHRGGFFDAEGDRIAPEPSQGDLSDTNEFNIMGKVGLDLDEDQRVQFMANYFDAQQDTDFASDPSVAAFPPGSIKARAIEGLILDDQAATENALFNLDYTHDDLLGSRLHAQAFYRDYFTRFYPFDGRPFAIWNNIAQTRLESETVGGRVAVETPISALSEKDMTLVWGVDYTRETSEQPAALYDPAAFDGSGGLVFRKIDDRPFVPPITHDNLGLFAQLEWALGEHVLLRSGVRHERIKAEVDDFVTLGQGNAIAGGSVDYSDTVFNVGAVLYATDQVNLFANFSQGFSLPDLGLGLRGAEPGFSISSATLAPLKVDNYEVGIRGDWNRVQASLSGFYSTSDRGVTSGGFTTTIIRSPERVYGIEATLDAEITEQWRTGGTFTWLEGENDADRDGDFVPLNGYRIPPLKLTGYVEFDPMPGWSNRFQVLYSGERDRAADAGVGFGGRPVEDYFVADLISTIDLGGGQLELGVENIFNTQYTPTFSQLLRSGTNTSHLPARGTVLSASYKIKW
jgi:iron complex outermembrane receptor protein